MRLFMPVSLALLALTIDQAAAAAPKKPITMSVAPKPAAKPPAKQSSPSPAAAPPTERTAGGFMVPKAVELRPTTAAEAEANAVWNVRAALNVAALQCQFSPYLATVKNYNDVLKQHSEELAKAQNTLLAHFKRYDGARAANSFDQYMTRTYNSYSTLDAQYAFCEAAGRVGREVLAIPKGRLGAEAVRRGDEVRAALAERPLSPALEVRPLDPIAIAPIADPKG